MTKSGFDFLQEGTPTPLAMSVCNIPSHHANRQGYMASEYKRTWMCIVLNSLGRYLFLRTASYRSIGDEPAFLRRSPRVPFSVFSWPFENVANGQIHTTARIIGDDFYLRWQYRFEEPLRFWSTFARERVLPLLCHHIDPEEGFAKTRTLLTFKLLHKGVKDRLQCMMCVRCPRCPTGYELGLTKLKQGVKVLEFTTWKNLGSGRTPRGPNLAIAYVNGPRDYG